MTPQGSDITENQLRNYAIASDSTVCLNHMSTDDKKIAIWLPDNTSPQKALQPFSPGKEGETTKLNILGGLSDISGQVTERLSGQPIIGAQVELRDSSSVLEGGELARIAVCDRLGIWKMKDIPKGNYLLSAFAKGYGKAKRIAQITAPRPSTYSLLLDRSGRLEGSIEAFQEGDTATVAVEPATSDKSIDRSLIPVTETSGQFVLDGLNPGSYLATVILSRKEGQVTKSEKKHFEIQGGETSRLVFDLRGKYALSGRVFFGREIASSGQLEFKLEEEHRSIDIHDEVEVAPNGQYFARLRAPGVYSVTLFMADSPLLGQSEVQVHVGPEREKKVDLIFATGSVRALILDSESNKIDEASFTLWRISGSSKTGSQVLSGRSSSGLIELEGLTEGPYVMQVSADGFGSVETETFSVEANKSKDIGRIVLEKEQVIRILVKDLNSQPVNAAVVQLYLQDSTLTFQSAVAEGRTDKEGLVELSGLRLGRYVGVALSPGYAPAFKDEIRVSNPESMEPLVIQANEGGTLEIEVFGEGGVKAEKIELIISDEWGRDVTPIYRRSAQIRHELMIIDSGELLRLPHIAPGRSTVTIWSGGHPEAKDVMIRDRATARLVTFVKTPS